MHSLFRCVLSLFYIVPFLMFFNLVLVHLLLLISVVFFFHISEYTLLLAFPVCSFINGLLPRRGRLRRLPASPLHACPLPHWPSTRITPFLPDRCCKFLKAEPRIRSFFPLPASTFCFPGANNALLFPFASFSAHLTLNPCQILPQPREHTGSLLFCLQE